MISAAKIRWCIRSEDTFTDVFYLKEIPVGSGCGGGGLDIYPGYNILVLEKLKAMCQGSSKSVHRELETVYTLKAAGPRQCTPISLLGTRQYEYQRDNCVLRQNFCPLSGT